MIQRWKYKDICPECGVEVLRHDVSRYDFCRGSCDILLNIPSYYETEKKILFVTRQVMGGKWEKITREEFYSLSGIVEKFCKKYSTTFPVLILH